MTREDLITAITEAIQREHGYTQHGIGETVLRAIETSVVKIGVDHDKLQAVLYPAAVKESLTAQPVTELLPPGRGWTGRMRPDYRGWYWIRVQGFGDSWGDWTPAEWHPFDNCFYSTSFSELTPFDVIVGSAIELPPETKG